MKQLDYVVNQCRTAIYAGMPIIYLESDDMGLIDDLLLSEKIVPFWYNAADGWTRTLGPDEEGLLPDNIFVTDRTLDCDFRSWGYGPQFKQTRKSTFKTPGCGSAYIERKTAKGVPFVLGVRNFSAAPEDQTASRQVMVKHVAHVLSATAGDDILHSTIIVQSPDIAIPRGLENFVEVITVPPLDDEEIREIILGYAASSGEKPDSGLLEVLVVNLRGFSKRKISDIIRRIDLECNGLFTPDTERRGVPIIKSIKAQTLKKEGLLKLKAVDPAREVSGLDALAGWVGERVELFNDPIKARRRWNIDPPKGILVSGIPGTGKSALANKIATMFNLPLLQFDMGSVLGKYTGESESNMRRVLRLAESMSPCVLWIDEIEKAFSSASSSGNSDGGQGKRLFGNFLTWMQEKTAPCFIFATANDISALPPEFLRRGRFDKKFYTFMPSMADCIAIFRGIIRSSNGSKGGPFPAEIWSDKYLTDIMRFCGKNGKFVTGADIEGIISDAKFTYYSRYWRTGERPTGTYDPELFRQELLNAIMGVQSYGETDMDKIAACLIALAKNQFAPAAGNDLIDIRHVDASAMTVPPYGGEANGYDELLYGRIAREVDSLREKKSINSNHV